MKKVITIFLLFILSLAMLLPIGCKKFDVSVSGTEKESPSVSSEYDTSNDGTTNDENTEENRFYTLSEIYESGEISRQELLSVIYYHNGGIPAFNEDQYPEDFVPTPKDPEELDESIVQGIVNTYTDLLLKENAKFYAGVEAEIKYYGTYGDYICVCIFIETPEGGFGASAWKETIDGVLYWESATFKVLFYKA